MFPINHSPHKELVASILADCRDAVHAHLAALGEPNGRTACLNDAPCPLFTSHGASIRRPFGAGTPPPGILDVTCPSGAPRRTRRALVWRCDWLSRLSVLAIMIVNYLQVVAAMARAGFTCWLLPSPRATQEGRTAAFAATRQSSAAAPRPRRRGCAPGSTGRCRGVPPLGCCDWLSPRPCLTSTTPAAGAGQLSFRSRAERYSTTVR
jgi:hypothetical protein